MHAHRHCSCASSTRRHLATPECETETPAKIISLISHGEYDLVSFCLLHNYQILCHIYPDYCKRLSIVIKQFFIFTYLFVCMYVIHAYAYSYIHTHICMYACLSVYINTCMHLCIQVYIFFYACMYVPMLMYTIL